MSLDLMSAEAIAKQGLAHAAAIGIKVSIAIVDDSGNVVYLARMDGAPFLSPNIALGKAFTSSAWRTSRRD